jgi:hypothetical protein
MVTTALPGWLYTVATSYPRLRVLRIPTPFFRRVTTWWPK